MELRRHGGDEGVARNDHLPLHEDRGVVEEAELPDRAHDGDVPRVPERLVLHRVDLPFEAHRHRGDPAGGMERLERADRLRELDVLELAQGIELDLLAAAEHERRRGVVVERTLERIDDLVIERRFRMLRQPPDVDLDPLDLVQPADPLGREDVDHPRREAAVRDDGEPLGLGRLVQLLLLQHDLGVAAEIAEMRSRFDRGRCHRPIEVIWEGREDRLHARHRLLDRRGVLDVERERLEAPAPVLLEELREPSRVQIRERNSRHRMDLQQVVSGGAALQARPQYQDVHRCSNGQEWFEKAPQNTSAGGRKQLEPLSLRNR